MTEIVKTGNKALTHKLSRLRGQEAAMLKLKGYTYEKVLTMLNDQADARKWGKIRMDQLRKDVARYMNFTLDYNNRELKEVLEGEKQMYLSEVERNYSNVYSLLLNSINYYQNELDNKKNGVKKPVVTRGQIPWMIDLLTKIGEHLSKVKGWGNTNNVNIFNIQNNELDIHTRAGEDLANLEPTVAKDFATLLDSIAWQDDESAGLGISEGVGERQNADGKQEVELPKS